MQNEPDLIAALLDFFGVADVMKALFAPAPQMIAPKTIETSGAALKREFSPLAAEPEAEISPAIASPSQLLPSKGLTISEASARVREDGTRSPRPAQRPPIAPISLIAPPTVPTTMSGTVLGEDAMNARHDSIYDNLVRNLARRKRQVLAEELGGLFEAIQEQGYSYADVLGAMREMLAARTSGTLWEDCVNDLDRAIEQALRAQSSDGSGREDETDRDDREQLRLETGELDRDDRSLRNVRGSLRDDELANVRGDGRDGRDRDGRGDRNTWDDSPVTN